MNKQKYEETQRRIRELMATIPWLKQMAEIKAGRELPVDHEWAGRRVTDFFTRTF